MKSALILTLVSVAAFAGSRKPLPGQAGNENIELTGNVIIDRDEIKQTLGQDLGAGYVVVKMQVIPKMDQPFAVNPEDFTLVSYKDGQRSVGLEPSEIAGTGAALVVKQAPEQSWGPGTMINGPMWAGVSSRKTAPKEEPQGKKAKEAASTADPKQLLEALQAKLLPEKPGKQPIEGLLYFAIDGKVRPKDLTVIYKGQAGRLLMEFAETK